MKEVSLKVPPHSTEAEQSLLGALMLDNQALDRISFLKAEHFYRDDHRRIFKHVAKLIDARKEADIITVSESIEASDDKEKTGGAAYLAEMATNTPSALNIKRYAEIVREKAAQRSIASRATEIAERALSGQEDSQQIAEDAAGVFLNIQEERDSAESVPFGQAVVEAVEIEDNPRQGIFTGLPDLDRKLGGLMPGDFIVIAARPSMGKTALAWQIAEHAAAKDAVEVVSIEMTRQKIAGRALRYHSSRIGRDRAVDHLHELKIHIDDSSKVKMTQLRARLRRAKQRRDIKLVVIDYLQLLEAKAEKRHEEVASVSRDLKAIAKELHIPLIAVAQLNRAADSRTNQRPMMSDLRESGQIEQDADVVVFLYREDYYRPDTEWRGIAEAIIAKNREGATGAVYLEWIGEHTRFKPLERALPMAPTPEPATPRRTVVKADFKRQAAGD